MQTENRNTGKRFKNDENVLDLQEMLEDYIRCIRKYWLILLVILILTSVFAAGVQKLCYEPVYQSKIAYAIDKTGDTSIDAAIAARLSEALPTVTSFKEFKDELQEKSEKKVALENYSISAAYTAETNFFVVIIRADSQKISNVVLEAFKTVYPEWAATSTGRLELQIVDESKAGDTPINPFGMRKMLLTSLLMGMVVCFLLMTFYVLNLKTVRRESDMQKVTSKKCISSIPDVKLKKRSKSTKELLLISNKRIDWGFKQAILSAQSRIEKRMEKDGQKVLLISSTIPQEGKSVTAVNLALAFAQDEKKILIMEGDLRNPTVGRMLGIEETTNGLVDYFISDCQLDSVIIKKGEIDIIPGGSSRGELSGFIIEDKMKRLMANLKERYDYILIDTPPSYLFADAAILSQYVDAVVYVVAYDYAELPEIRNGISTYLQNDKLLGYLLNRNPGGYSSYGKYGYSQYGVFGYGKHSSYGKYKHYLGKDYEAMNTEDSL